MRESAGGNLTVDAKRSLSVEGIRIRKIVARHGEAVELFLATLAQEGSREGAELIYNWSGRGDTDVRGWRHLPRGDNTPDAASECERTRSKGCSSPKRRSQAS